MACGDPLGIDLARLAGMKKPTKVGACETHDVESAPFVHGADTDAFAGKTLPKHWAREDC